MKKQTSVLLFSLLVTTLTAQTLRNEGSIVVSGSTTMNIQGSYVNDASGQIVLDGTILVSGDWTNNNSSNGVITAPGSNGEVQFVGSGTQTLGGTSTATFDFEKLTVNNGATLVVPYNKSVTAYGNTTLNGTQCFVLQSSGGDYPQSATFIDNGTIGGSGTALVECKVTGAGSAGSQTGRYWYLSAPVSGLTNYTFQTWLGSGYDNVFKIWDNGTVNWKNKTVNSTYSLETGRGVLLRTYQSSTFNLVGNLLTGNVSRTANRPTSTEYKADNGFYVAGNPYMSYTDWDLVYASSSNLEPSIYYRTYDGNEMITDTYNAESKVSTSLNPLVSIDKYIAPMQSFWVKVNTTDVTGAINFTNAMRGHTAGGTSMYLKSIGVNKNVSSSAEQILRLYLSGNSYKDEAVFALLNGALDGFEKFDSEKKFNETPIAQMGECFSVAPTGQKLVINSVPIGNEEYVFPIGLKITTAGSFLFSINVDKISTNYSVVMEDTLQKIFTDLRTSALSFSTDTVSVSGRFLLHINYKQAVVPIDPVDSTTIKDSVTNSTILTTADNQTPMLYGSQGNIYVKNCTFGASLYLYDLLGRYITQQKITTNPQIIPLPANCYVAKLVGDKVNITRKVIVTRE